MTRLPAVLLASVAHCRARRRRASSLLASSLVAWSLLAWSLVVSLFACGPSGPAPTDPRALRADSAALVGAIARDPAPEILAEADGMIDDRRPVRAAEIMRSAAIPAVRRQLARVGEVTLRTDEGRALQARAVRAYRRRIEAIERYAAALARGELEDETLLEAVRAHRAAEEEVLAVIEAAQALGRPAPNAPAPPAVH